MQRRDGLNRRPFRPKVYSRENNYVPKRSEGPTYWQRFRKTFSDTLPEAAEYGWNNFKQSVSDDVPSRDDWQREASAAVERYKSQQAPEPQRWQGDPNARYGPRSHSRRSNLGKESEYE